MTVMDDMFKDKTLLITGGTGSFGHAVLDRFLSTDIREIRIFSRDEKKQDDMRSQYHSDKVKFYIGDALEIVPGMDIVFDLAFVDGNKRFYVEYYEMILQKMHSGGYIIADNTLWDGHVIDPAYDRDHQTKGIRAFNDLIANDPRVEVVILPLRDGLTLIRKK